MRISDWSSDVCSSDLPIDAAPRPIFHQRRRRPDHRGEVEEGDRTKLEITLFVNAPRVSEETVVAIDVAGAKHRDLVAQGARKSVVQGKSVSVRVDHGGRRNI